MEQKNNVKRHWKLFLSRMGLSVAYCGNKQHSRFLVRCHTYWQRSDCRHQTILRSGTIFNGSKLLLREWFQTMFQISQSKNNISVLALKRHLVASSYVLSDRLYCFAAVEQTGMTRQWEVVGAYRHSIETPCFICVNTLLGNPKAAITGPYHAFGFRKYAHRCLAEIKTGPTADSISKLCCPPSSGCGDNCTKI